MTDLATRLVRRAPTRAVRPPNLATVVACGLFVVWSAYDVLHGGWWVGVDEHTSELVRHIGLRRTFVTHAGLYAVSQLGARGAIVAIFAPFVAVVAWRRRSVQPVLRFAVAVALLTATVYAFKLGVGRAAPPIRRIHSDGQSFPSGHAPNAVLMWALVRWIAIDYDLPQRVCRVLAVMRYAAPAATCLAMLLLDYHWLSDLLAGLAMGVLLLWVLHALLDTRLGRWGDGIRPGGAGGVRDRDHDRDVAAPGTAGVAG